MRGTDVHQEGLFSYLSPESRIPKRHPLRPVREMVDIALSELSGQFESMYSDTGRRSIPPEKLLRARCRSWLPGNRLASKNADCGTWVQMSFDRPDATRARHYQLCCNDARA